MSDLRRSSSSSLFPPVSSALWMKHMSCNSVGHMIYGSCLDLWLVVSIPNCLLLILDTEQEPRDELKSLNFLDAPADSSFVRGSETVGWDYVNQHLPEPEERFYMSTVELQGWPAPAALLQISITSRDSPEINQVLFWTIYAWPFCLDYSQ